MKLSERLPFVLVLDGSSSMAGARISELNEGIKVLEQELKKDETASQRVQLLVIRFGGGVDLLTEWIDARKFESTDDHGGGRCADG